MRTLAIDSSTEACSVALIAGQSVIAGECRVLGRGHAEQLVPMIAALPDNGRADRIAVSLGPGSFTGVRVGIAAARALAFAWGAQLVGYPTLALIAAMAQRDFGAQPLGVVTSGGHGEWFVQRFGADGGPRGPVESLSPQAAATHVGEDLVVGGQSEALVAARGYGVARNVTPDARAILLLGDAVISDDVLPVYGRAPDAKLPGERA